MPTEDREPPKSRRSPLPRAIDDALRALARRPLTESEVRNRLANSGHSGDEIETAVQRLLDYRYVDDASLAHDYIAARSARLGHGKRRLLTSLTGRGVAEDVAEQAWNRAVEGGAIDPRAMLERAVERRLEPGRPLDRRHYRRVYNALLRAGFAASEVFEALSRRFDFEAGDVPAEHGNDHDIA